MATSLDVPAIDEDAQTVGFDVAVHRILCCLVKGSEKPLRAERVVGHSSESWVKLSSVIEPENEANVFDAFGSFFGVFVKPAP